MTTFRARKIDHGNSWIEDGSGAQVAICDAEYVNLLVAAPVMLEALTAAYDALAFCDQGVMARKIVRRAIDLAKGDEA